MCNPFATAGILVHNEKHKQETLVNFVVKHSSVSTFQWHVQRWRGHYHMHQRLVYHRWTRQCWKCCQCLASQVHTTTGQTKHKNIQINTTERGHSYNPTSLSLGTGRIMFCASEPWNSEMSSNQQYGAIPQQSKGFLGQTTILACDKQEKSTVVKCGC